MTLERLQAEMIAAMKANQRRRKDVLSSSIAAIKKAAIDKRAKDNITEALVDEVLTKEKKTLKEMIDTCPADREDLLNDYEHKYMIISEYAPKFITDEVEIKNLVLDTLDSEIELSVKNKGVIMKTVMPVLKGKVDMQIANKVITELLN